MAVQVKVVALDVIETLFSLEPLRDYFIGAGLSGSVLELWFATALRDAFAMAAAESYEPLKTILESALDTVAAEHRVEIDSERKTSLIKQMQSLPAHPDVAEGLTMLRQSGAEIIAVTNGSTSNTKRLLEKAGFDSVMKEIVSTDDVERAKPHREVYLHAAKKVGIEPGELMLIASHPWDIHGAKSAGLKAAYLDRGKPFPSFMRSPDLSGESLPALANSIAKPGSGIVSRAVEEITD